MSPLVPKPWLPSHSYGTRRTLGPSSHTATLRHGLTMPRRGYARFSIASARGAAASISSLWRCSSLVSRATPTAECSVRFAERMIP